jgi:biopolymer transport protein ExbD
LADWLVMARAVMPQARIAIKSDRETPYKHIEQVVNTLTANQVLRFNLLTDVRRLDD